MKYRFIINPRSGPRKKTAGLVEKIRHHFSRTEHAFDFVFTTGPGDATRLARLAVSDSMDIAVAVGGDGTVNEVATGLVHSGTALGIIPMGSGNGIARSLDLPLRLGQNIRTLSAGIIDRIDCGEINGNYFFGISGIGFDARIGHKFQHFGVRGPIPYFVIGVHEFLRYRPQQLTVRTEDREIIITPLLLAVANTTQYGNGALIAPMADPRDGWFEICYLEGSSMLESLLVVGKLFKGTIAKSRIYHHFQARSLRINGNSRELIVHLDGEPRVLTGEVKVQLHPRALRVAVGKVN